MMVWKQILEPKNPALTIHEVAGLAQSLGYPMFSYEGKIYKLTGKGLCAAAEFEDTGSIPDMFVQPDVYCVMDSELKKIAMNKLGPMLFSNPVIAQALAEKMGGQVKTFNEAIYLQAKARENESPLVLPEKPGLIVPASR